MPVYDVTSIAKKTTSPAAAAGTSSLNYKSYTDVYGYLQEGKQCESLVEKISEWIGDTTLYNSLYNTVKKTGKAASDKYLEETRSINEQIADISEDDLLSDSWSIKKPKAVNVNNINWIENTICVAVPATIYQILKLIDEALKTPIRLLDLIKDISDRILEAIENKIMNAIDCIYKNLRDLAGLLYVDFSATIEQIRYILYACPFLASAIADMMNLKCSKCQSPVECIDEMLSEAAFKANEPYRSSVAFINKIIGNIRRAVSDFINKISDKVNGEIDKLIQKYIEYVYEKEMIPMLPFPGDKGPCDTGKAKYWYTIHDALIICKRWIRCLKAICSLASDTAANELDVILNKIDIQTSGIFYQPIAYYVKSKANVINGMVGADKYTIPKKFHNNSMAESLNKIREGIKAINDDNNIYFAQTLEDGATRNDLHGMHVPFYRAFASDFGRFGVVRSVERSKKANRDKEYILVEYSQPDKQKEILDGYADINVVNSSIADMNTTKEAYAAISEYEKTFEIRAIDTVLSETVEDHAMEFSLI